MTTTSTAAAEQLDRLLQRWRQEEVDDALDEIAWTLEELIDYARGDRSYPDAPGTQAMAVNELADRALTALTKLRLSRTFGGER